MHSNCKNGIGGGDPCTASGYATNRDDEDVLRRIARREGVEANFDVAEATDASSLARPEVV